jgi:GTPase SAR1 family protein
MEASDKKVKKERPKSQQKKKRDEEEIREISIAVLGAVNVGKSAFINQYYYKRFLEEYQPTISHSFSKTVFHSFSV